MSNAAKRRAKVRARTSRANRAAAPKIVDEAEQVINLWNTVVAYRQGIAGVMEAHPEKYAGLMADMAELAPLDDETERPGLWRRVFGG